MSLSNKNYLMKYAFRHGLRTPNKAFFHWNLEFLGLGRQIVQIDSGVFGVFSAKLSAPILVQWVPCFSIIQPLFLQKTKPYIHIPNIYLGLWFKFGLQRIRNVAFMCPQSVGIGVGITNWVTMILHSKPVEIELPSM